MLAQHGQRGLEQLRGLDGPAGLDVGQAEEPLAQGEERGVAVAGRGGDEVGRRLLELGPGLLVDPHVAQLRELGQAGAPGCPAHREGTLQQLHRGIQVTGATRQPGATVEGHRGQERVG